ncbi:Zn-ribbon domain-containing OB-fold protein [Pseudonocardia adelaidensis]|uniref:Zn-ribbon domain-containing OB-fold protein n=1 Tax=Pseudonocardia adelaidensis TaxID=648754 RepID=A0ABP9N6X6_9PSEU
MSEEPTRPLPVLTEADTAEFWRACGEHRLTYGTASDGEVVFFPRRTEGGTVHESAGRGVVYTFTVVRRHGHPYFRSRAPYVVAYVDLDEGFRMMAEVDADPAAVHVGMRVEVGWEDHEETAVPVFRPARTLAT